MSDSFDDFSREQGSGHGDLSDLIAQAGPQWKALKEYVAKLDGKPYKEQSLAWVQSDSMLALDDVVAAFEEYRRQNSLLHGYRVVFSRRPNSPGKLFTDPVPYPVIWDIEPKIQKAAFSWHVDDLNRAFPASELSLQIAIRLAKYDDEYKEALSLGFESE